MSTRPYQVQFDCMKAETFNALGAADLAQQIADAATGRAALRKLDPDTPVSTNGPEGYRHETVLCDHWRDWPSAEDQEAILRSNGELEDRLEAVCAAYTDLVRDGEIADRAQEHGVAPEEYARALWSHGKRNGWLPA